MCHYPRPGMRVWRDLSKIDLFRSVTLQICDRKRLKSLSKISFKRVAIVFSQGFYYSQLSILQQMTFIFCCVFIEGNSMYAVMSRVQIVWLCEVWQDAANLATTTPLMILLITGKGSLNIQLVISRPFICPDIFYINFVATR